MLHSPENDCPVFLRCRLKTENGGYSSRADLAKEEQRTGAEGRQAEDINEGLRGKVSAEELRALRDMGFEADSSRPVISHADAR